MDNQTPRGLVPRWARSVPEEQHADQDKGAKNRIPDKVHPMDALTATKAIVFVIGIKTIPALFHLNNHLRQKLYADFHR